MEQLVNLYEQINDQSGGWIPITETWTRTGNHTFTINSTMNLTFKYRKGTKIRYKDGGNFEYGVVNSSSYSAPTTTINLIPNTDFAMAATTITDTYLSYIGNPEGFPESFNYTTTVTPDGGSITSYTVQQAIWSPLPKSKIKIDVTFTLTNIGTGTGSCAFTAPVNADALYFGFGREGGVTGNMLQAVWSGGDTRVALVTYNNGAVLTNNFSPIMSIIGGY